MAESLSTNQELIKKLTEIVLTNLRNTDFDVTELARQSGMSRSALNRKLRRILNKSINQFIREVRLKKSFELLKNGYLTVAEVAYSVGFASPAYFNACFHEFFGYPPGKGKGVLSDSTDKNPETSLSSKEDLMKKVWERFRIYKEWILTLSVLMLVIVVLVFSRIFNQRSLDDLRSTDGRISVAVMPFENLTDERLWEGIQNDIISYLSNFEELKVRQKEAITSLLESKGLKESAFISASVASRISRKLDASIFINGNISIAGSYVRVNAQLVNARTKEVFKSYQINGSSEEDNLFKIIDSLSFLIKNYLVITKMGMEVSRDFKPYKYTSSPEAYKYFILADYAFMRNDNKAALNLYSLSVAADSNFIPAAIFLSMRYSELGLKNEARKLCLKIYEKRNDANIRDRIMVEWYHATLFETPSDEIKYLRQYQDIDDKVPVTYWQIGNAYLELFQYSKAIPEFERALEIYKEWGVRPMMIANYTNLGFAYHKTGQCRKEKRLYKKAEKNFPDKPAPLCYRRAICALTEGDTVSANRYTEKFISAQKELFLSEAAILNNLARLYSETDILDKAEEYYRQSLSLEPESPSRINNLAYFLIDKDKDLIMGMEIIEKALKNNPDNPDFLHTRGWGMYKQGKQAEALVILQRSRDLKPGYDHSLYLHLLEVKTAVSE